MSTEQATLAVRVADLRRAFDESFARKPPELSADERNFLALRQGPERYAIRLEDVAGLFADKTVVPFRSRLPELLGIAGIRGSLVPVFSLGQLLGYPRPTTTPRWLFVSARSAVAFAFDELDGYLRAPSSAIAEAREEASGEKRGEMLVLSNVNRVIVGLQSFIDDIANRAGIVDARKEP